MGLGRESFNALLPLYLFKEHWSIAYRKAQPLYGFICTNDVMGYVPNMGNVLPFLVFGEALRMNYKPAPSAMEAQIL